MRLTHSSKTFELHGERSGGQLALVSRHEIITPMYGSEPGDYDTYAAI